MKAIIVIVFFLFIFSCTADRYSGIKRDPQEWQDKKKFLMAEADSLYGRLSPFPEDYADYYPLKYPYVEDPEGAFSILLNTEVFASSYVGFAGEPSEQAIAFNVLLAQEDSKTAFLQLLEKGHFAGQLYGLCGLYFLDKALFDNKVTEYNALQDSIYTLSGCVYSVQAVKEIVKSSRDRVLKLKDGQTIADWYRDNYGEGWQTLEPAEIIRYDIVGGAWPQDLRTVKVVVQ